MTGDSKDKNKSARVNQSNKDNQSDRAGQWMPDNNFGRWISPIVMSLGSLKHERVKACSISSVPEKLRSSKVEAYKPKVVSIGPLHRGTSRDLLYMEEIKWRCAHSLLYRADAAPNSLERCSKVMLDLVDAVRATYLEEIKIDSYELAKIMLLDGCFLLELLISSDTQLNEALKSNFPGPGSEVRRKKHVLSDLKLLENQIPLFILDALFNELFQINAKCKDCLKGIRKTINEMVLFLFGYASRDVSTQESQESDVPETAHFLEHIHWYITQHDNKTQQDNKSECIVSLPGQESQQSHLKSQPKLKYCATRLKVAGITIGPPVGEEKKPVHNPLELGCYKEFINKRLGIQPLHITAKTVVELWNFIAWEQSRITRGNFIEEKTECPFSESVSLLKDLVCCEEDIKLLKNQEVLMVNDAENMSDEDLMNLLRAIVKGIQIDASIDSRFGQMINNLNKEYSGRGKNCRILWHQFKRFLACTRYMCRSSYQTLKRDHTPTEWKTIAVLYAVALLFLTIAQVVFAAIGL